MRTFYSTDYELGLVNSSFDAGRAAAYAALIESIVGGDRRRHVLEIGCGGGLVLDALAKVWQEASFTGLEASATLANRAARARVTILNQYLEDFTAPERSFDLVFAINVMEHAAEPQQFLKRIAALMMPSGIAVLVFPSVMPNLELLFLDHIHTFTGAAFAILAARSGLRVIENADLDPEMGNFQFATLSRIDGPPRASDCQDRRSAAEDFTVLAERRHRYLDAWHKLDATLDGPIPDGSDVFAFGAGETAALLRAYAPQTWRRVAGLLVDELAGARRLGKTIATVAEHGALAGATLLLATHPRSHAGLAARFRGCCAVLTFWDDIIAS